MVYICLYVNNSVGEDEGRSYCESIVRLFWAYTVYQQEGGRREGVQHVFRKSSLQNALEIVYAQGEVLEGSDLVNALICQRIHRAILSLGGGKKWKVKSCWHKQVTVVCFPAFYLAQSPSCHAL